MRNVPRFSLSAIVTPKLLSFSLISCLADDSRVLEYVLFVVPALDCGVLEFCLLFWVIWFEVSTKLSFSLLPSPLCEATWSVFITISDWVSLLASLEERSNNAGAVFEWTRGFGFFRWAFSLRIEVKLLPLTFVYQEFPHWREKSSGVIQSKILKSPVRQ